jgi:hypothetical protein
MQPDGLEYTKTIWQSDEKDFQWRLTVSNFMGVQYLHIRKYFLTFEEDYQPTREGLSIPLDLNSTFNLAMGLCDLMSNAEATEIKKLLEEYALRYDKEIPY